jgi:hypothetical protein
MSGKFFYITVKVQISYTGYFADELKIVGNELTSPVFKRQKALCPSRIFSRFYKGLGQPN